MRSGPGLGGGANAVFKRVDFNDTAEWAIDYDLSASARSADSSSSIGGVVGASNDTFRFHVLGSTERGDDLEFPGGTIRATSHERDVYGVGFGVQTGNHAIGLDLRRQETGDTGNPPFPMDIRYFNTDFSRLSYNGSFGDLSITAHASYVDVSHLMTNFHLRPAPANMMRWRQNHADATTTSGDVAISFPFASGDLQIGADIERVDKNAIISNPNNSDFFLASLPKIESERFGAFTEWTGIFFNHNAELGIRVDSHDKTADLASTGPAVPMMPANLANAFNDSDREWDAVTTDLVARVWRKTRGDVTIRGVLGHKQRAPGYVEIFSWLPTGASGGLADGNIYVGNQDLDIETAWITEIGADWSNDTAYLRATGWYRSIDDFITGAPFDDTIGVIDSPVEMVANMNGDSTPLRWANVEARLYGLDLDYGLSFGDHWRVDGGLYWLTGERRDIDDHLYRIAPPSMNLALTHQQNTWSATLETVAFDEQDEVSEINSEQATPGYVLLNAHGDWRLSDNVVLSAGVENLLDHTWRDHLAGYNRVRDSDVSLGERLPGAGRNAFIRLTLSR